MSVVHLYTTTVCVYVCLMLDIWYRHMIMFYDVWSIDWGSKAFFGIRWTSVDLLNWYCIEEPLAPAATQEQYVLYKAISTILTCYYCCIIDLIFDVLHVLKTFGSLPMWSCLFSIYSWNYFFLNGLWNMNVNMYNAQYSGKICCSTC